jgi:tyrosyl-tRNA synthetase
MSVNPGALRVGKVIQREALSNTVPMGKTPLRSESLPCMVALMDPLDETIAQLKRGGTQIITEGELKKKLQEGRPLRVKLGVDPTSPDLHLGHSVNLFKLRQFQDIGHIAVLIIGDFTSMVGDPSGRSSTRPMLTYEQVMTNAQTYLDQAFKILDRSRTETVFNGEWFKKMTFLEIIRLNSQVTIQQMLQRDDFKARVDEGHPIALHELQYPIMQGWDSVMVRADIEMGGTDQLFNIMVGRDFQKAEGQPQQVACLQPILEGLDGVQKMSKSFGNYVGIDEPPSEMFGKLMSISDPLMTRYYEILLCEEAPQIHPMEAKKQLAFRIVERFHDSDSAQKALDAFNLRFTKKDLEAADLPEVRIADLGDDILSAVVAAYGRGFSIVKSRSEARRLVEQGSVQWHNEKVTDPKAKTDWASGGVLKLDKTHAVRVIS